MPVNTYFSVFYDLSLGRQKERNHRNPCTLICEVKMFTRPGEEGRGRKNLQCHVSVKDTVIELPNFFPDKEQTCDEVLSNVTEGVCRPLRNRVEQILLSEHGAVILYRLTNLIRFDALNTDTIL